MIYLTGDTHGYVDSGRLLSQSFKKDDILIILGDFGWVFTSDLNWYDTERTNMEYFLKRLGCRVLFIDGNHENFDRLNNFPVADLYGGKVHIIANNCFHLMRGEIYTIEGKTFLALGGAFSIDFQYRELNKNWWTQENITEADIKKARENLKAFGKVDYILTHACPYSKIPELFDYLNIPLINGNFGFDDKLNEKELDKIYKEANFKGWYCGHYHTDYDMGDVKVLYRNVIPLK